MYSFSITKREILLSIAIVCVMLIIGIVISEYINDSLMTRYQEYNTALQIENDRELFEYGMRTNVGNAFVYGELKALDPVTHREMSGEYSCIEVIEEKRTSHTRIVSDGETTRTEVYYTWDEVDRQVYHSTRISFLGVEFDYGAIDFSSHKHLDTVTNGNTRYLYYGSPAQSEGTLYAVLSDHTVNTTLFFPEKTISDTISSLESRTELIVFWAVHLIITALAVYGFYRLDNWWLEDHKKRNEVSL